MATSAKSARHYSITGPSLADYTSMMLKIYCEALDQSSVAQVLDVGPVCEENITFFAQRVKRFHVCDLFLRLNRNRREDQPLKEVWKHLGYAPHSFNGINMWDFMDHINDDEIGKLVNLCHTLLKTRGMMIVTSFEEQSAPSQINSFVMQNSYRITFRPQNHLNLPYYYRSNRILTDMLSEFASLKSFIYRNGVREFLCRRD